MSSTTGTRPAESDDRLNSAIHRLKLAAEDLGEVAETPAEEHYSAAFVVVEATEELVKIYDNLTLIWCDSGSLEHQDQP